MSNDERRGKRDILQSLDYLLYCHIAYLYFLDASFLLLFFRLFLQMHLLSATMFYRVLHVPFIIVIFVFFLSTCIHLVSVFGQSGIIIDFIGSEYPPNIMRLCLLDTFILLCQLLRLYIAQQLSIHSVNGAMFQISQALSSSLTDTNQQSQQDVSDVSTTPTREASTTSHSGQDYNTTQSAAADSNDVFYHNDVVMGLSSSQVSQLFNTRRHHYSQVNEENTMELHA
ncbi:hypothetical protein BCR42DRAFT_429346 [Absidia repens]|uniref:DUF1746 domain-containing protein n=1 Tax=Absidia repens TaxID=90262 RepID=A0A1X2HX08_9FUNG|nr:hypothetical protein BCR42DRAFT_429346 [Absidia repens]